ncbi:hypothetical protein EDD11_007279 [Mortierella claussenii]|nr:hypothetical protein EDD11_007279 [Mortierella claussenii]
MNFFKAKKRQEELQPAATSTPNLTLSSTSSPQQYRQTQRQPSINGSITIPPRTNSTNPAPSLNSQGPLQQVPAGQVPGGQVVMPGQSGQQPFYQQQQQQQPSQFYQQQQPQQPQQLHLASDSATLNSSLQALQQQVPQQQLQQMQQPMQMQGMLQPGSYSNSNDAMLQSQGMQYSSYQDQSYNAGNVNGTEESCDGGYVGDASDELHLAHQQLQQRQQHISDSNNNSNSGIHTSSGGSESNSSGQTERHYPQTSTAYDPNHAGTLSSGPLQLPNQNAGNNSRNDMERIDNTNNNSGSMDNAVSGGLDNSSEELSTDVHKLQDEILSWRKSQESSQLKVSELRTTLTQKSQESRELHQSLMQVTQDRLMLQELVHKREKEMDDLRSKYLNDVRQIRATDEDHWTIERRVRLLQAAILQLTKSSSGDRAVNLNAEQAQQLVKKKYKFGNTQPYILNMFLEKYIMDTLLEEVFHGPFYVGCTPAKEYAVIHKWMLDNNFADQAMRFRQQACFVSHKAPVAQQHAVHEATRIAKAFEAKLGTLYHNWTGQQKVLDMVTKAIELSLAMRSQDAEVQAQVIPSEAEFDAEKMVPAHKSKEGGKVKVCVMPCFIDTKGAVVGKAKVFCG